MLIDALFEYELLVLDQNSGWLTSFIIKLFRFNKVIILSSNIGMAKAWTLLNQSRASNVDFVLQLENDWWCAAKSSKFLLDAINVFIACKDVAFVKLRSNYDFQAGLKMINKEPQTVYPLPLHIFQYIPLRSGSCALLSNSKYACFTFNPTLMRANFRDEISSAYSDNENSNVSVLRSGEDYPTVYWERQQQWRSAIIGSASFRHTGFHSRRYIILGLPLFYLVEFFLWIRLLAFRYLFMSK